MRRIGENQEEGSGVETETKNVESLKKSLPIFIGAALFIIGIIALYTAWPKEYHYTRPSWYMWAIALLIAAIALVPMEKKKMFMGFAVVAFSLALISHIYDKWDDYHKSKTYIVDIDKNWSKWFVVGKDGESNWTPDRAVGYQVMSPGGHITTYPATKNPDIHIPGFPDSLRFKTTDGSPAKIRLVIKK